MRNLTGVLEATVLDPSSEGPRRLTDRRPQRAKENSASTGNPPLSHQRGTAGRSRTPVPASLNHRQERCRQNPATSKPAGRRRIFTPSRRPRTGPGGLTGIRSMAGVLHKRMSNIVKPLVPSPQKPWTDRPRQFGDPEIAEPEAALRQAMDERAGRLGEHAVETSPPWAVQALGPVPEDPVDRLDWQQRDSKIATYRELYGIGDERDVSGKEPTQNAPEMRAARHDAFAAITHGDGVDVRELPDSSLEHMRGSYQSETGWAPPHVGKQLQDVRLGAGTMRLKAIRAEAEARIATDPAIATRHATIAATARALEAEYRGHEATMSEVMEERNLWDKLTEGGRRLAVQADLDFRRRHPARKIRPLETAEPEAPGECTVEPGWRADLEEQRRVFRDELEARQNVMG